MDVKDFQTSINEGVEANVFGFLDYPIKIADRLTGANLPIDQVIVDRGHAELHIVINTEATKHSKEIYDGHYGEASDRLAKYQTGQLGGFFTGLYDLIGHADPVNLKRLRSAYPDDVAAWENWQIDPDAHKLVCGHCGETVAGKPHMFKTEPAPLGAVLCMECADGQVLLGDWVELKASEVQP